jgi:hypothetical protein
MLCAVRLLTLAGVSSKAWAKLLDVFGDLHMLILK